MLIKQPNILSTLCCQYNMINNVTIIIPILGQFATFFTLILYHYHILITGCEHTQYSTIISWGNTNLCLATCEVLLTKIGTK